MFQAYLIEIENYHHNLPPQKRIPLMSFCFDKNRVCSNYFDDKFQDDDLKTACPPHLRGWCNLGK